MEQTQLEKSIQGHYDRQELGTLILHALTEAGKDPANLQLADLAPVDEFHIRGRKATMELAQSAGVGPGMHLLDAGSGIGGPSRFLAAEFGCKVTGIDLTGEYCRTAAMLTEKVGLSHLVSYRQGDACHTPFGDGEFDIVWTQHTAMNISAKGDFYREMHRVLKPGGTLAIYDILAGPIGPVHFPVPWAKGPETSFLETPEGLRQLLEAAGFEITSWLDSTEAALDWFRSLNARPAGGGAARTLGLHLLMGENFPAMVRNQLRNLEENRIVLCQVTARK